MPKRNQSVAHTCYTQPLGAYVPPSQEKHVAAIQDFLTDVQLAARWHVSVKTVRAWRTKGIGPRYLKLSAVGRGAVRYRLVDIAEYETAQLRHSTSEVA